jgi:hypothetical protein
MSEIEAIVWSKMELKNLRANLPKGWKDILASEFELTPGAIKNVLSGLTKNDLVLIRAVEIAKDLQDKIRAAREAASTL